MGRFSTGPVVGVGDELIVACHLVSTIKLRCCDVGSRNGFAAEFVGRCDEPAVLVDEHLMDAHLMSFGIIVEAGVIDEQCTTLMIDDSRVVSLGKFGSRHGVPLIVGQDLHTDATTDVSAVVEDVAVVDG